MIDAFSLFGLPRRPGLYEAHLREIYLRLAANLHPDATAGDTAAFASLQEALAILSDPARRLRHLSQLVFPDFSLGANKHPTDELFFRIGDAIRRAQAVLEKYTAAQSALAKALLAQEMSAALAALREQKKAADEKDQDAQRHLEKCDAAWPAVSPEEIAALATEFTYLAKWRKELSEWEFRLAEHVPVRSLSAS